MTALLQKQEICSNAFFEVLHGKLGKGYKKGCKKSTDDF